MRRIITMDIETLPAPDTFVQAPDRVDEKAWEAYLKTALTGDFGQILCIGLIDEDSNKINAAGVIGWDEDSQGFASDEKTILRRFWNRLRGFRPGVDRIVGHNIFDFDLKFIYKRSVIHGIHPSVDLSFARYRNQPIFDTMCEWERWSFGTKISLDKLARVIGVASSKEAGINGSHIFELWTTGQHKAIRDYCLRDVEVTRSIYRRMVFADCTSVDSHLVFPNATGKELCAVIQR